MEIVVCYHSDDAFKEVTDKQTLCRCGAVVAQLICNQLVGVRIPPPALGINSIGRVSALQAES